MRMKPRAKPRIPENVRTHEVYPKHEPRKPIRKDGARHLLPNPMRRPGK